MTTYAEQLAAFAIDLQRADIPAQIWNQAKLHFLDTLGIAIASSRTEFGAVALAAAQQLGEGHEAQAIGTGTPFPASSAALVNGTLAHSLDFDDTHIAAIYHASAPAFAASLAVAQARGASGKALLEAYIVAVELGSRLALAGGGQFHKRGFHPTSLCGTFAAAAAAGRLSGDGKQAVVDTLGLCGSMASGILELKESWLKRLHPGWAAHAGIVAAALGRSGFKGPRTVLEGGQGFYATHIEQIPTGSDSPAHDLGKAWMFPGIALKPYPCCHFIHAFVDAALELRQGVDLDDVVEIRCQLSPQLQPLVGQPRERRIRPPTIYDALFSVPYVVALALAKGRVDLASFYDEPLDDPAVLALAARTWCDDDPLSDYPAHFPGEVRLILKDGSTRTCRKPASKGSPDLPLTTHEVEAKFHANVAKALPRPRAEQIVAMVADLENVADIGRVIALCDTVRR